MRGFLQSSADFLDDHAVARQYLTPAAGSAGTRAGGTSIYDRRRGSSVGRATGSTSAVVDVHRGRAASTRDGASYAASPSGRSTRQFGLAQVERQWRIAGSTTGCCCPAPTSTRPTASSTSTSSRPPATLVVPDPVLLPDVPGADDQADDPAAARARPRRCAAPSSPRSRRAPGWRSASVAGARRAGDGAASTARRCRRRRRRAQQHVGPDRLDPASSCRTSQRVRIIAGGDDLVTSGVPRSSRDAWPQLSTPTCRRVRVAVRRARRPGRPLVGTTFTPVRGRPAPAHQPGPRCAGRRSPSTATSIAALERRRAQSSTSARSHRMRPLERPARAGGDVSTPRWDPGSDLWFVDRTTEPPADVSAATTPTCRPWPLPKLAAGPLQLVRVSRGGARIALVAGVGADGPASAVGAIVRGPTGRCAGDLGGAARSLPDLRACATSPGPTPAPSRSSAAAAAQPPVALAHRHRRARRRRLDRPAARHRRAGRCAATTASCRSSPAPTPGSCSSGTRAAAGSRGSAGTVYPG